MSRLFSYTLVVCCAVTISVANFVNAAADAGNQRLLQTSQDGQEDSRQIVPDEFTTARPSKQPSRSQPRAGSGVRNQPRPKRRYRRSIRRATGNTATTTGAPTNKAVAATAGVLDLGVTIWRLRPSKAEDGDARILVQEGSENSDWTPERVEAETALQLGDRVRISIESPRTGYLYVIDRELYADGTMSDPYMIFPTTRTRNGNNRVQAGRLVDIPAQEDRPNYFTLKPSRPDQVGELLTILVTPEPLSNLVLTGRALKLPTAQIESWEKAWSASVEKFELEGGAGKVWTKEEKEASTETGRILTQEDPAPQTIYRIAAKANNPIIVSLPLRYKR